MPTQLHTPATRRSGQAMVELTVALIAILVVTAGLLQLILLGTADTDTMVEATAEAANRATSSVAMLPTLEIIDDWDPGRDGIMHTKDDQPIRGSIGNVSRGIANRTAPGGDWSAVDSATHNRIARLAYGALPSTTYGLVRGRASREVEVLPAARALFGLSDPAEIRNEVWMTVTGALY